ncbi:hypothetical protein BCR35DRAFT_351265 [Leucosporidium creatinivorum]|uniref:Uncharacterized protein n=1 Tax=Leucosporidium creatinivorum TaxID=106004 RepID=A0A1Y2FVX0_9BASI|nr:hypothetical protein BCR35DRAFT_351265 [Leucosporidium creatinivorum]
MPSFTKLILATAVALVACSSFTSALPADSNAIQARALGGLPSGDTLDGRLLRKRLAKIKRTNKANAAAALTERNLVERENNGRGNDNGKGKGNGKGNNGDNGNGHGNGDDDDQGDNNGHGGDNGNHFGKYKFDVNNCGYKGHVCPSSYNGVGEPKCYFGVCTIDCPRGQRLKHKRGQVYCA